MFFINLMFRLKNSFFIQTLLCSNSKEQFAVYHTNKLRVSYKTRIIGETGLFIAEVAAWGGALAVLVFSYFYTVRREEHKYMPRSQEVKHAGLAE